MNATKIITPPKLLRFSGVSFFINCPLKKMPPLTRRHCRIYPLDKLPHFFFRPHLTTKEFVNAIGYNPTNGIISFAANIKLWAFTDCSATIWVLMLQKKKCGMFILYPFLKIKSILFKALTKKRQPIKILTFILAFVLALKEKLNGFLGIKK